MNATTPLAPRPGVTLPSAAATVAPAFVLFFAMTPDAAAGRTASLAGLVPVPPEVSSLYLSPMEHLQRHLLGETFARVSRVQRTALGRLNLSGSDGPLTHADIYVAIHKCGAAVWEVSVFGPSQPFDIAKWIGWLDLESPDSPARTIWDRLARSEQGEASLPEIYIPLSLARFRESTLAELRARHGRDLISLLHRDTSGRRFKTNFVEKELAADFCRREEGLWLLARNSAIAVAADSKESEASRLSEDVLPLLLTLEVLCLDRAVLRSFLDRFAQGTYGTVDDLIQLRREIFDNLEEYYGTLAKTHSYTEESIARGEILFGIDDLFKAVTDRLEALTFEITTRNQRSVNRLGLWLTTSFGAIETGFVAASIATWYYRTDLFAVLGWTVGVTLTTAVAIAAFLRWKMKT